MKYLICKIIGILGFATAIAGIVTFINSFGDFDHFYYILGGLLLTLGIFFGAFFTILGFLPQLRKAGIRRAKRLHERNAELIKEMTLASSSISQEIFNKATDLMYCKHCGKQIDKDSKFCKGCGKEQ